MEDGWIRLERGAIEAWIDPKGAELKALRRDGLPYLYEGDAPGFWPKSAPLLFPAVGRSMGDAWTLGDGRVVAMPRHGFARDCGFDVLSVSESAAVLELRASDVTRLAYPFDFRLVARHHVDAGGLHVHYRISNEGGTPMPFSFGLHPAFRWPIDGVHAPRDAWRLRFPKSFSAERHVIDANGYRSGATTPWIDGDRHALRDEDFSTDAIVLRDPPFSSVRLECDEIPTAVEVRFTKPSWIGFWTQPGAPFLCIEPWWGVAACAGDSGRVNEKEAIRWIAPGEAEAFEMAVRLE